jgi:hypothetical protein
VDNIEQLLVDIKESLEREVGSVKSEMRDGFASVTARFDTQSARLDRQAALLQAGTRWTSRMDAWADKIDVALEAKDREIAELRERLARLERKSA